MPGALVVAPVQIAVTLLAAWGAQSARALPVANSADNANSVAHALTDANSRHINAALGGDLIGGSRRGFALRALLLSIRRDGFERAREIQPGGGSPFKGTATKRNFECVRLVYVEADVIG